MPPLVSIAVPSLNQGAFLEEALESLFAQDYPRLEVVVADGGSSDGSADIIARHAERLAWWASEPDGGQAPGLNRAFAHTSGELLGWLNADDTLLPGAVSAAVGALAEHPEALLAYGDAIFVDADGREQGRFPAGELDVREMMRRCEDRIVQPGMLFRRSVWAEVGPLSGYFALDFELVARIGMRGPAVRLERPLATYRLHPGSKSTSRPELSGADFIAMYDRFFARDDVTSEVRAVEAEARSQAYLTGGELLYAGLELRAARAAFLRAIRTDRRRLRPRTVVLILKTFLPAAAVTWLRGRRAASAKR
jgi:glycosyltransferase involved in cell wall biosynthesis